MLIKCGSFAECQHYSCRSCRDSVSLSNECQHCGLLTYVTLFCLCPISLTFCVFVTPWSQQCASKVSGGGFSSSKEFPDEVLRFVRSHPVMYRPVLPQHHRPVLLQTEPGGRKLTQIAVDRVQAQDGHYHVLYIGTGKHFSTKQLVP